MQSVRSGEHLEQIGETWYYRRVVPADARDAFGKPKERFSLRTKSRVEAQRLEKIHDVEFEAELKAAREAGPDGSLGLWGLPRRRRSVVWLARAGTGNGPRLGSK
jgi:hypothetical protein